MKGEVVRVDPFDTNFEKWGAPVSTCTRAGNMISVSGMPPFNPETGEVEANAPFERQAELVLTQMKTALEAAGSGQVVRFHPNCRLNGLSAAKS